MQRVCFRLQIQKELMNEYISRHANVWPEMLNALSETGWHNYSIFIDEADGTLIGYFETPDLELALAGMAKKEINAKWQSEMQKFFMGLEGVNPDEGFLRLREIFYLQ